MAIPVNANQGRPAYYAADRLNVWIYLRRYVQLVARRWVVFAVCTALGLGFGIYRAVTSPDIFRAWSVLRIAPRVQTGFTSQAQYQEVLDKYYENQLYDMQSAAVLDKARLKARESYKGPEPLVEPKYRALRGQGSFFQMVVDHTDFDYARLFSEVWAKEFVNFKSRLKSDAFEKTSRATRDEVIRYEEKLNKIQSAILEFKRSHDIANIRETLNAAQELLNQLFAEQTKYSTLRQLLENTTKEAIASGALIDNQLAAPNQDAKDRPQARQDSTDPLAKFNTGSKYRDTTLQLRSKEAERNRWQTILRPKHDYMIALDHEIERLRRELQFELDLIEESRKALLASYRQNEKSYEPLIKKQNESVLNSSGIQHEFNKLTEEEVLVSKQLTDLRRSLSEIDLTLNSNEDDLTISEAGSGSRIPVAPNRPRAVLVALIVGMLSGLGIVYLLHRLDDRLDLAEDVERELEEPILGQVPFVNLKALKKDRLLVTDLPQHDIFAESIRGVRSSVILGSPSKASTVLVVTSAVPGDGKTTFTVNFAATMAIMKQRVLLVDVDLRRGTTHQVLRTPREPGLSEALEGKVSWRDVVHSTEVETLSLITTGAIPANPGELLLGRAMTEFLKEARESYDYVILDTPPLISINDTLSLLSLCDGVIFVVRSGQTSMRFAKTALAAIRQREAPILGLVLNGITSDNPSYYYQQYYHAYYNQAEVPTPVVTAPEPRPQPAQMPSNSIEANAGTISGRTQTAERRRVKMKVFKERRATHTTLTAPPPGPMGDDVVASARTPPPPPSKADT